MSWVARTSTERPYVIAWGLFCFWVNGWLATLALGVLAGPDALLPQFLPGQDIPRTLYSNAVSLVAVSLLVALTLWEVRLLGRWLPALDGGRDTPESRRLTGVLVALCLTLLVAGLSRTGVNPFSVIVLGLPPLAVLVEFVVIGLTGVSRAGPATDGE